MLRPPLSFPGPSALCKKSLSLLLGQTSYVCPAILVFIYRKKVKKHTATHILHLTYFPVYVLHSSRKTQTVQWSCVIIYNYESCSYYFIYIIQNMFFTPGVLSHFACWQKNTVNPFSSSFWSDHHINWPALLNLLICKWREYLCFYITFHTAFLWGLIT